MSNSTAPSEPPSADADHSIERRRAILRKLGQGTVVAAAAVVPVAASAGMVSRWRMDPSRRAGIVGNVKLGVSS